MEVVLTTVVAAITSLSVVVVTHFLTARRETISKEKRERERVNLEYLNPLRLHLVENYFRLLEIKRSIDKDGKCEPLLYVADPKSVSQQSDEWFNAEGCYLISSCYFTACLFCYIWKVRDNLPYLSLGKGNDTRLLTLILKVSRGFRKYLGVFYATQPSIGIDMFLRDEDRLMSYREFCQTLQNPPRRVWFDRLLYIYIDVGEGRGLARVDEALFAIHELSEFLDRVVGGGDSIQGRLETEGIESL